MAGLEMLFISWIGNCELDFFAYVWHSTITLAQREQDRAPALG